MKKIKKLMFIAAIMALSLTACENDNENNPSVDIIEVTDDITVPTVWATGNIYLIKAWDLHITSTLTIQPGAIIKFTSDGKDISVTGEGTIKAIGTALLPIVFTSFKDDSQGGDSNGDGVITNPSIGDWNSVYVETNGSEFVYCEFYYGGGSTYLSTLEIYDATASIDHCSFIFNKGGKFGSFYYGVLDVSGANSATTVTNNVFYGNTIPLSIMATINIDQSNIFHNTDSINEINTMNGIFVHNKDGIKEATTWLEDEVPFVITSNQLIIESVLHLGNNVALKFTYDGMLQLEDGINSLNQGSGVIFTSFKDDSVKGDTNGDASAGNTDPMDGDWEGIYDDSQSGGDYFTWNNIYYDNH